jgi:long-subunit acyl-CoA synthetase (AMP-forming)
MIAHIGSMMAGGKAMGVYSTDTADTLAYKVLHTNSSVAFCQGPSELEKFEAIVDDVPYLKVIVTWAFDSGMEALTRKDGSKIQVVTFQQFRATGEAEDDVELDARMALVKPTHCACLIYTRYASCVSYLAICFCFVFLFPSILYIHTYIHTLHT